MIREAIENDTNKIIEIWLLTSREAHSFIPFSYWESKSEEMREVYLPKGKSFVIETDGHLVGFLSLIENHLAALFILPQYQNHGYGQQLLNFAKSQSNQLSLYVYEKNKNAVRFYEKHGFTVSNNQLDINTNQIELLMKWCAI